MCMSTLTLFVLTLVCRLRDWLSGNPWKRLETLVYYFPSARNPHGYPGFGVSAIVGSAWLTPEVVSPALLTMVAETVAL